MKPTLSIILPTHARHRELTRCLHSIRTSGIENYEILLISDIHDHKTFEVAEQYLGENDKFIERGGIPGPAESRNLGLTLASGQWILIFDDDDQLPPIIYPDFYHDALAQPDVVTYGDVIIVEEDREKCVLLLDPPQRLTLTAMEFTQIYVKNFIFTQACLFPAYLLKEVRQDTHMRSLEDWDFLLAVASYATFKPSQHIGAIIYKDYVHQGSRRGTSVAANNFEVVLDYLYVCRRWPAPTEQLKAMRAAMLAQSGFIVAKEYL